MMFFTNLKRNASFVLSVGVVSLMVSACGTDGASDVGTVPTPTAGELVLIDSTNADQVLASSVGSIGQVESLLDRIANNFPGLSVVGGSGIAQAPSGVGIDGNNMVAVDKLAITLASRECAEGGSVVANAVSTDGGSVTFNNCQERGVLLNGSAEVSINSNDYFARFTSLSVASAEGSLFLSDAGVTVVGNNFDFAIASGSADVQGAHVEFKNFVLNKQGSAVTVNGSVMTDCLGAWINIATVSPLTYSSSNYQVGGTLSIVGSNNSNMQVIANSDSSIGVTLNGVFYATYASALDLPYYGAVCQ